MLAALVGGALWGLLGIGETEPDYIVAFVGAAELPEEVENALLSSLEALGTDVNGDGEVVVALRSYVESAGTDIFPYESPANVRLMADLTAGESVFFVTDGPQALQERYGLLAMPDGSRPAQDDISWEGKAVPLGSLPALGLESETGLHMGGTHKTA